MYEELRKEAKQKVEARVLMWLLAIIFSFAGIILIIASFAIPNPSAVFWLRISVLILMFTYGFLYLLIVGLPNSIFSKQWQEEEIEKEMARMYRRQRPMLPPPEEQEELSEEDRLELKELERLQRKWYGEEDYL